MWGTGGLPRLPTQSWLWEMGECWTVRMGKSTFGMGKSPHGHATGRDRVSQSSLSGLPGGHGRSCLGHLCCCQEPVWPALWPVIGQKLWPRDTKESATVKTNKNLQKHQTSVALAFVLFSLQGNVHKEFQFFSAEALIFNTLSNT